MSPAAVARRRPSSPHQPPCAPRPRPSRSKWLLLGLLGCAGPRPLGDQPGLSGSAAIRCEPADAKLWVDGVERGTAQDFDGHQQTLRLAAGPHRLSLEHQGYRSFEAELIVGDFRQTVAVKLLPLTD